jgi:hypothetical protein
MTWLFCIACAAQMYCVSGLTEVSPNPPVVRLGLVAGEDGDVVGDAEDPLGADVVAGDPHATTAALASSTIPAIRNTPT